MSETITKNDILSVFRSINLSYHEYKFGCIRGDMDVIDIIVDVIYAGVTNDKLTLVRLTPLYTEVINKHSLNCSEYMLSRKVTYVLNRCYKYMTIDNVNEFDGVCKQLASVLYSGHPKLKKLICYIKSFNISSDQYICCYKE